MYKEIIIFFVIYAYVNLSYANVVPKCPVVPKAAMSPINRNLTRRHLEKENTSEHSPTKLLQCNATKDAEDPMFNRTESIKSNETITNTIKDVISNNEPCTFNATKTSNDTKKILTQEIFLEENDESNISQPIKRVKHAEKATKKWLPIINVISKAQFRPPDLLSTPVPSLIPIFRPKKNLPERRSNNLILESLPHNSNLNSKQLVTEAHIERPDIQKEVIGYKNINRDTFNHLKMVPNPNKRTSAFNIPCQRASDILNEPLSDVLQGNPRCSTCSSRKSKLNPATQVSTLKLQRLPMEQYPEKSYCNYCTKTDNALVILRPKTSTHIQKNGNILKKMTTSVILPFCVLNVTP